MNFGKIGLLLAFLGLVFAAIPLIEREQMSTTERFASEMQDSVERLKRHVAEDSRFELSLSGGRFWHTLAMVFAISGGVMGLVSLSTEKFCGGLAVVIGIGVAAWEYLAA